MEIYKDLSNPASQEFEKLLNSQLSKIQIEEGKIIEGKINKITEKFVFLFVEGLKSEPVLDVNELKSMGLGEKIKIGEIIPVLLEKIEDKHGEVLVSASKAQKIKGWDKLVEAYEKSEPIMGKITSKCKGGCIVEHIDTGSLMFLPGSQISDKPLKDISHLMNEPQKFALIKLDKVRGNACVSRREIISSFKKEDKAKIVEKYKVGDIIKGDKIKVKVLEIKASEQKIRVGLRQTQNDPFDYFNDKKKNQTITVKVISTDNKGLTVRPEN
ncbi:30S ribosomal protein S1, partial [Candidatus Pelagibacter sp.]|nr:30S ribosomal protein S1 [Candidatus Pelagibacter sp.]